LNNLSIGDKKLLDQILPSEQHQKALMYGLCILGTFLFTSLIYGLRIRRLKRHEQELMELVDSLTKELQLRQAFVRRAANQNPQLIYKDKDVEKQEDIAYQTND
jgi:ABC-type protease/lipase transport system fused ATPase/permease subunit